ncbi:type II toxin-antitoxin system MqsR family toxin [Agitococcus lubricus]|nr:type II toxin-antitoxin system MqsR family toxin [Agitococcus lubricus]
MLENANPADDIQRVIYHVHTQYGLAYVKVTLWPDSRVVIQFKGK